MTLKPLGKMPSTPLYFLIIILFSIIGLLQDFLKWVIDQVWPEDTEAKLLTHFKKLRAVVNQGVLYSWNIVHYNTKFKYMYIGAQN